MSLGLLCVRLCCVQILPELMPDALHPNAAGMELLAQCLSPVVDEIMAHAAPTQHRHLWPISYGR